MYKPKVSIIVPVYNTNLYLKKCLDSLINQSFDEIEVICINDGSTDSSLQTLNSYASKDFRIRIFSQENMGVSAVRNRGLDEVRGDFLMFLDSDDWFEHNTCSILLEAMDDFEADVILFPYIREYSNGSLEKKIFNEKVIVFNESDCKWLHRRHVGLVGQELKYPQNFDALCSTSTKLYRTDIIRSNGLRFVDTSIVGSYEDGLFNLHYFRYVNKAVYVNEYLFHYRKTNLSSHTNLYNPSLVERWDNLYEIIGNYINVNKYEKVYFDALQNRIAVSIITLGINVAGTNLTFRQKVKTIKGILRKNNYRLAFKQLDLSHFILHWYIYFWLCKRNCAMAVTLMSIWINRLRRII